MFPAAKTGFTWTPPTVNVDGTPIIAGEVDGYQVGVRTDGDAAHSPGNYSVNAIATGATASAETFKALGAALKPGNYWGAIQTLSASNGNSVYTSEVPFSIPAPVSPPLPPTGFSVA